MDRLPYRAILLAALSFALLNQLWLTGGNASWVTDSQRGLIKGFSLALAVFVYIALVILVARRAEGAWWKPVAVSAALAVGIGAITIVTCAALWYRGQFFHDASIAERLPSVCAVVTAAAVLAAALSPLVGAIWHLLISHRPRGRIRRERDVG